MSKPVVKQKTTWAAIALIVSAAGGYLTGETSAAAAIQVAIGGLMGIFFRQSVNK